MKHALKTLLFAAVTCLTACGGSPSAFAAPITNEYIDARGVPANLTNQQTVTITSQTQLAQLQKLPAFAGFVQLIGTTTWLNLALAGEIICYSNTLDVGWLQGGSGYYNDPGCATYNYIVANAQH